MAELVGSGFGYGRDLDDLVDRGAVEDSLFGVGVDQDFVSVLGVAEKWLIGKLPLVGDGGDGRGFILGKHYQFTYQFNKRLTVVDGRLGQKSLASPILPVKVKQQSNSYHQR